MSSKVSGLLEADFVVCLVEIVDLLEYRTKLSYILDEVERMKMVDAVDDMVDMDNILSTWNILFMLVMIDIVDMVGMVYIKDIVYLVYKVGMEDRGDNMELVNTMTMLDDMYRIN